MGATASRGNDCVIQPSGDSQVVSDPLTARGRSEGSRSLVTDHEPCSLFLGSRADLIWLVQALGYVPTHIHVRDASLLSLVRRLVPLASIVTAAPEAWRVTLPPVAFIQGYAQGFGFLFDHCELVFSTRVRRRELDRAPSGWTITTVGASHAQVGGGNRYQRPLLPVGALNRGCFGWDRAAFGTPHFHSSGRSLGGKRCWDRDSLQGSYGSADGPALCYGTPARGISCRRLIPQCHTAPLVSGPQRPLPLPVVRAAALREGISGGVRRASPRCGGTFQR
jgi:hypothetical protein